jgi:hypothetical protein
MNYKQTDNLSELILAMVNFNSEFQNTKLVKDGKNDHLKNKYLTLDNILNTVRPILTKHGLVIVQALAGEYLVTTIYHVSGQYIQTDMPFHPMSGKQRHKRPAGTRRRHHLREEVRNFCNARNIS